MEALQVQGWMPCVLAAEGPVPHDAERGPAAASTPGVCWPPGRGFVSKINGTTLAKLIFQQPCGLWLFSAPRIVALRLRYSRWQSQESTGLRDNEITSIWRSSAAYVDTPEHPPPVYLAGQGSEPAQHLPEEVGEHLASLPLSQQLLSKCIRYSRKMHEGLDVSPMTLCRQKATSSVPQVQSKSLGLTSCTLTRPALVGSVFPFLLGPAVSPGTLWAPRKAFQPGLSAGFVRLDFLFPFFPFSLSCREAGHFLMSH